MEIEDLVRTEPRLLSMWEIGPVQRAAIEQFAERVAQQAIAEALVSVSLAVAEEREECAKACRKIGAQYPTDIWPEGGQSIDCKSARMARLTAANIEREITERSNANVTGLAPGKD